MSECDMVELCFSLYLVMSYQNLVSFLQIKYKKTSPILSIRASSKFMSLKCGLCWISATVMLGAILHVSILVGDFSWCNMSCNVFTICQWHLVPYITIRGLVNYLGHLGCAHCVIMKLRNCDKLLPKMILMGYSDNGSTLYWPPGLLHTLDEGGHIQ